MKAPTSLARSPPAAVRPPPDGTDDGEQLQQPAPQRCCERRAAAHGARGRATATWRRPSSRRPRKGFDLIVLGASQPRRLAGRPGAGGRGRATRPATLAIVKARAATSSRTGSILVPFDGGVFARVAVEFAVRYAEATGAELTIALLIERMPQAARLAADEPTPVAGRAAPVARGRAERVSRIFRAIELRPHHPPPRPTTRSSSAINDEASSGSYDLVVIGAENRAIQHRLFFGYDNERLLDNEQHRRRHHRPQPCAADLASPSKSTTRPATESRTAQDRQRELAAAAGRAPERARDRLIETRRAVAQPARRGLEHRARSARRSGPSPRPRTWNRASYSLLAAAGLADAMQDLVGGERQRGAHALLEHLLDRARQPQQRPARPRARRRRARALEQPRRAGCR